MPRRHADLLVGHVDAKDLPARADQLRQDKAVASRFRSQIQHSEPFERVGNWRAAAEELLEDLGVNLGEDIAQVHQQRVGRAAGAGLQIF